MLQQAHGVDLIDIFAGGHLDSTTTNWLQEKSQQLRTTLSDTAASFIDSARNMYTMISVSDAAQILRNLKSKVTDLWSTNRIFAVNSLEQLQTANPIMQRYLMAHVELRKMYLNQEVEGYEGSYVNYHGDVVGVKHYDWRRVMDGIVTVDDNHYGYTHYYEDTGDDEPLSLHEKVDILRSWALVSKYLDEGVDDPSSSCGAKL